MTKLVTALTQYLNGEKVVPFGSSLNQVRPHNMYSNQLGRVFNDGHGFLTFAQKDENNVLYVNTLLLSNKEKKDIQTNMTGVVFSELGYPDYYQHDLISVLKKEEIKQKKFEEFMKQMED